MFLNEPIKVAIFVVVLMTTFVLWVEKKVLTTKYFFRSHYPFLESISKEKEVEKIYVDIF